MENYSIQSHLATISKSGKGWTKDLKLISWYNQEPKYDLRIWSPDGIPSNKGLTFTLEELQALNECILHVLNNINKKQEVDNSKQEPNSQNKKLQQVISELKLV